jgi:hypothetical protein
MAYRVHHGVFCVVHGPSNPTDDEWKAYLEYYLANERQCTRTLVVTKGGGPNAKQRSETAKVIQSSPTRVAIVSSSTIIRGVATALSWFNKRVQAFHANELDAALSYLEVPEGASKLIQAEMQKLQATITD